MMLPHSVTDGRPGHASASPSRFLRATGLRRGDAVKVGRPHLRDRAIRINTEKTGERVAIAATDELLEAIAAGPCGEMTFVAG
jgi:integrase